MCSTKSGSRAKTVAHSSALSISQVRWLTRGVEQSLRRSRAVKLTLHLARASPKTAPAVAPTCSCELVECLVGSSVVARPLCASPPGIFRQSAVDLAFVARLEPGAVVCGDAMATGVSPLLRPHVLFPISFSDLCDCTGCARRLLEPALPLPADHQYPLGTIFISRRAKGEVGVFLDSAHCGLTPFVSLLQFETAKKRSQPGRRPAGWPGRMHCECDAGLCRRGGGGTDEDESVRRDVDDHAEVSRQGTQGEHPRDDRAECIVSNGRAFGARGGCRTFDSARVGTRWRPAPR